MARIDIRNFGTLVALRTWRWVGKVSDRQAAIDQAIKAGATSGAYETKKNLLAGADIRLKAISQHMAHARTVHYGFTLPWSVSSIDATGNRTGSRLLPNVLFEDYVTAIETVKADVLAAVQDFVSHYESDLKMAEEHLGDAFVADEYPCADEIAGHFGMTWDFSPVPIATDFDNLQKQQADTLAQSLAERTTLMVENAMQDIRARLHNSLAHIRDRLRADKPRLYRSMIYNVQELCRQLQAGNIVADPRIEDWRQRVKKRIACQDIEDLRADAGLREQVARTADTILAEMDANTP